MIPISTVQFGEDEERAVLDVLRSGMIAQGPKVAELEARFTELAGTTHAVAVNNGTTALIAAFDVLDLKPGEEVITTPFTFVATLNAALHTGATVVLADVRSDDFNIDPESVRELITPRTRVVVPVHLYGQMADMAALSDLASDHGLRIVEDAAQAAGATFDGHPAGSYGLATFSLYATKNVTTGEGGVVTTDSDDLADRLRVLRNQGMRARYEYVTVGNNYRLTDLQAALAIPQLDRYDALVRQRDENATALSAKLAGVEGITVPRVLSGRRHVWHQYTIRVDGDTIDRDRVVARLAELGVGAGVYYPHVLTDYPTYGAHPRLRIGETPVARRLASEVISLPVHPRLTVEELAQVASATESAVRDSTR